MFKNIIISILLITSIFGIASATGVYKINGFDRLGSVGMYTDIYTTKVSTPEGTYRLFITSQYHGCGISAVSVK